MKTKRKPLDFYETHAALTKVLLNTVDIPKDSKIIEPTSGLGAICNVLINAGYTDLHWNDINTDYIADTHYDVTLNKSWDNLPYCNWVIMNPPFNQATQILKPALRHASCGVAALLPLTFLEPCRKRRYVLNEHNKTHSDLIVFNPRPRFRTDTRGTDPRTVAWFVWQTKHQYIDTQSIGTRIYYATHWQGES